MQYTLIRPPIDPAGRIVIVIDDGLATGATMISALHGLRVKNPARLICAIPVAPPDTLKRVAKMADEVVCLQAPEYFQAVGQFYQHFSQIGLTSQDKEEFTRSGLLRYKRSASYQRKCL